MFLFTFMFVLFIIGYVVIALEHPLKINKTATALLLGVLLWVCAVLGGDGLLYNSGSLQQYLIEHPDSSFVDWLVHSELLHALGEVAEILFFLMGAMTIVEIIDTEGGFKLITDNIKTKNKIKFLWIIAVLTFFMSAVLDNLTTSIVMVALLRKLIDNRHDRWIYASVVILAANSGGAWSPIGDVTTIMLWIAGYVSSLNIIEMTFISSAVSVLVPLIILSFMLKKGEDLQSIDEPQHELMPSKSKYSLLFLLVGVGVLVFIPIFKTITHLPPYIGMLGGLSILWILSEIIYRQDVHKDESHCSILQILTRIDIPSILFFLGILLAVNALKTVGHLELLADKLDTIPLQEPSKYYVINVLIGIFSSIVDNVPLVAGAMGMYHFPMDHYFWEMLAYCAGTGGSILIIGSAAGVSVMGMEKIDFIWYLKHISGLALLGYLCGCGTFVAEKAIRSYIAGENTTQVEVAMDEESIINYLNTHTFYTTNGSAYQNMYDSVKVNFLQYKNNDISMYGIGTKSYIYNFDQDTLLYYQHSDAVQLGQVDIQLVDTMAYIRYAEQNLLLGKSGRLFLVNQPENPIELKRLK